MSIRKDYMQEQLNKSFKDKNRSDYGYRARKCKDCGIEYFSEYDVNCGRNMQTGYRVLQDEANANNSKKDMMSEYRRGVEDATKDLYDNGGDLQAPEDINALLLRRRKQLLTKKVTKWVNINEGIFGPRSLTTGLGVFSSKADAEQNSKDNKNHIGSYPIEVEVPID